MSGKLAVIVNVYIVQSNQGLSAAAAQLARQPQPQQQVTQRGRDYYR